LPAPAFVCPSRPPSFTEGTTDEPHSRPAAGADRLTGYFDNGWAKSSADPQDISTSYDDNPLGEQASRTITSAGGSSSRTMTWGYFPDGKPVLPRRRRGPTGLAVEVADNSDFGTTTTATWATSSAGAGYQGYNYATHAAGTETDAFTWNLDIPQDGNYTVYVKYPAVSGEATNSLWPTNSHGERKPLQKPASSFDSSSH